MMCVAFMVIAILSCSGEKEKPYSYEIKFYADTVCGHLILTSVCSSNNDGGLSISSMSLGKVDETEPIY